MRTQITQYSPADQDGVQATMRAIVRANPTDPQGWLCLSACVMSLPQRRDCLEQGLRLDPRSPAIHAELQLVREQELHAMQQLLSDCRSIVPAPAGPPILRLGEYFQSQGLSADHIQRALELQRMAPLSGRKPLLGEILVAHGWSTPEHVAELLMRQASARVSNQESGQLNPLGEYLLRQGHISIEQLQSAVITQLRAIQVGKYIRLGEVLISERAISAEQLAGALRQQEIMYGQLYY